MKKRCLIVMAAFILIASFHGWADAQISLKQDAMSMVEKAGKLIEEKGDAALAVISDPNGQFVDRGKALYVFVYDKNIVVLAHPYRHELIGQSMKGEPDDRGRMFHDEIVRKALAKGSGWTWYVYQKPTEMGRDPDQVTYRKNTYGKLFKHGDKKYIVCSGRYK